MYRNGLEFSIAEMEGRAVLKYRTGKTPEFNAKKLMGLANQTENLETVMKKVEQNVEGVANVVTRSGKKKDDKIALIGLDNSGKTSLLYKLKFNEDVISRPSTIGFNVEMITFQNVSFVLWDISGQSKMR